MVEPREGLGEARVHVRQKGRRAAIVAAAKRVDFTEAWDILAEAEGESNDFFERIVEAERNALKRRFI